MAPYILQDTVVVFAGGTVTTLCKSCTINITAADVSTNAFGGNGWETRIPGLRSGTVAFEFMNDVAAIDAVLAPLVLSGAGTAAVKVRGGTAVAGSGNPEYQFTVVVTDYQPVNGAVGDLATTSVTLPITGAVTRATA